MRPLHFAVFLLALGCSSENTTVTSSGGTAGTGGAAAGGGTAGTGGAAAGGGSGGNTGGAAGSGGSTGGAAGSGGSTGGAAGSGGSTGGAAGAGGADAGPSCTDQSKNGDETDVDCGGSCPPCAASMSCGGPADCVSKVCTLGKCDTPSCIDLVMNGDETDTDCGGSCPTKCKLGAKCVAPTDCETVSCASGFCAAPTCTDGSKNGDETDKDCGGSCTKKCGTGEGCAAGADCTSQLCDATLLTCKAPDCSDTKQNGDETDVDCGGSCTKKCDPTQACLVDADCASQVCDPTSKKCKAPDCHDTKKNGDETDVDCGGSCSAKCGWGQGCKLTAECGDGSNGKCTADKCVPVPIGIWQNVAPASPPPPRWGPAVAYDPGAGGVVVFGGSKDGCGTGLLADVWVWDGSTWKDITPSAGAAPSGRWAPALAYDSGLQALVLAGGGTLGPTIFFDETWSLKAGVWTKHSSSASVARARMGMTFHGGASAGNLTLFGGTNYFSYLTNTAQWNGTLWTQPAVNPAPGAWAAPTFEYDSARTRSVLFGGTTDVNDGTKAVAETWEWTGSSWIDKTTASAPPARFGASSAFDSVRGRTIVAFGYGVVNAAQSPLADTWEWDGTTWTRTATGPAKNSSFADTMAYDPVRRRSVLFYAGYQSACANETWEYYTLGNPCTTATDCASGVACVDGLCCAASSCSSTEACNTKSKPGYCTTK